MLAELLPDTHVFKAFNTVGVEHMAHPDGSLINDQQLSMMFAGGPEVGHELDVLHELNVLHELDSCASRAGCASRLAGCASH